MHYAANVFPSDDAPSRYLLLLASGDEKHEISTEATKVLYGTQHKSESNKQEIKQLLLPDFQKLVSHIHSKMQKRMLAASNEKSNTDNKVLPYTNGVFTEVMNYTDRKLINFSSLIGEFNHLLLSFQIITYLRICLAKSANITVCDEPLQHPCESTPLLVRYLENLHKQQPDALHNYFEMISIFTHACAGIRFINIL